MWTAAGQRIADSADFGPVVRGVARESYRGHVSGNSLYRKQPDGKYVNVAGQEGAAMGRWAWSADGVDWDLDGTPEIFITCGMLTGDRTPDLMSFFWRHVVARSPARAEAAPDYENGWNAINQFIREGYSWNGGEPNVLLRREGNRYVDVSGVSGLDVAADSRAFAAVDLDGDGIPDLVLKNRLGPQVMAFRNESSGDRLPLVVDLEGTRSNRDAIGAKVELLAAGRVTTRWVAAGSGYLSQHSKSVFFSSPSVAAVRVTWPSGDVEMFDGLRSGMRHRLREGGGVASSTLAMRRGGSTSPIAGLNAPWRGPVRLLEPVPLPGGGKRSAGFVLLHGAMEEDEAARFALLRRYLLDDRSPGALPAVLMLNQNGDVTGIAPGRVAVALPPALPFAGTYLDPPERSFFRLAMPFVTAGYPEAARPMLERALRQEPANFKLHLAAGQIALESEQLEEAERLLTRAKALGESADLWNNLGALALERRQFVDALKGFEQALKLNPRMTPAMVNAGQASVRLGEAAAAERYFRQALELVPSDADAANHLGLLLARAGRNGEAQRLFERAIESRRDHAAAINNLAILFATTGRRADAIAALVFGTEAAPHYDLIWLNLARLQAEAGERPRAISTLERFLARRPGHPEASQLLERLRVP
jgi:Tfp pilus assembly protein PilF